MLDDRPTPFPPYAYVPGGAWPHPVASPLGHAHGRVHPSALPINPDAWRDSSEYLEGVALFNAGYYWEAHEVWERLWHAHGRVGPIAELLKSLIKLAAAGVKVREGRPAGVATHMRRAAEGFAAVEANAGSPLLGLDLRELRATAERLAVAPPDQEYPRDLTVARVFGFELTPR
jgi:predicted metal-dependent hydrolase